MRTQEVDETFYNSSVQATFIGPSGEESPYRKKGNLGCGVQYAHTDGESAPEGPSSLSLSRLVKPPSTALRRFQSSR